MTAPIILANSLLAVAPDRPRWFYASLANLRRGAPPKALDELPLLASVVNTYARKPSTFRAFGGE